MITLFDEFYSYYEILKLSDMLMAKLEAEQAKATEGQQMEYRKKLSLIYRMRNNAAAALLWKGCPCELNDDTITIGINNKHFVFQKHSLSCILQKDYDSIMETCLNRQEALYKNGEETVREWYQPTYYKAEDSQVPHVQNNGISEYEEAVGTLSEEDKPPFEADHAYCSGTYDMQADEPNYDPSQEETEEYPDESYEYEISEDEAWTNQEQQNDQDMQEAYETDDSQELVFDLGGYEEEPGDEPEPTNDAEPYQEDTSLYTDSQAAETTEYTDGTEGEPEEILEFDISGEAEEAPAQQEQPAKPAVPVQPAVQQTAPANIVININAETVNATQSDDGPLAFDLSSGDVVSANDVNEKTMKQLIQESVKASIEDSLQGKKTEQTEQVKPDVKPEPKQKPEQNTEQNTDSKVVMTDAIADMPHHGEVIEPVKNHMFANTATTDARKHKSELSFNEYQIRLVKDGKALDYVMRIAPVSYPAYGNEVSADIFGFIRLKGESKCKSFASNTIGRRSVQVAFNGDYFMIRASWEAGKFKTYVYPMEETANYKESMIMELKEVRSSRAEYKGIGHPVLYSKDNKTVVHILPITEQNSNHDKTDLLICSRTTTTARVLSACQATMESNSNAVYLRTKKDCMKISGKWDGNNLEIEQSFV